MWQLLFYLSFVVWLYFAVLSSHHLVHVRRRLLDFGFDVVVVNVFDVLLCRDLTTAESSVKVWRW